jgi:hypothetical protein
VTNSSPERRREDREPAKTDIQIEWVDHERATLLLGGQCRNVPSSGIGAVMVEPVPLIKEVTVRLPEIDMVGKGIVRHCLQAGALYLVGIELMGPLRTTD